MCFFSYDIYYYIIISQLVNTFFLKKSRSRFFLHKGVSALLGLILLGLYLLSTLCAAALGRSAQAGSAVLEGAREAVSFCLSLGGALCLWSSVLELLERCGGVRRLSRVLRPLLCRLFPGAAREETLLSALTENLSANLLGLGNAATPAGIRAARGMARRSGGAASDELCLLLVLNTASLQLLPTTVAAIRAAAGAASAFDILPAVWLSSLCSLAAGLLAAALLRRIWP